jgi:hypothetical protein
VGEDEPGLPPEELGEEGGDDEGEDEGDPGGCGIEVEVWPSILQPASAIRLAREPSIQNLVRVFMT